MNYLTLENVSKTYGEKVLFQNLSLQISKGQRIALVAKNGSGKSTLLRVVAGKEAPEGETAKVFLNKDIKIAFLDQDPEFMEENTVFDEVFRSDNPLIGAIRDYERALLFPDGKDLQKTLEKMDDLKAWDFESKIKEVLSKLKVDRFNQKVKTLSGGQKKRLALAKMVIDDPEFLILDEPTNHLDIDMIEWLEEYLDKPNVTLFMVTHDRFFLERVCNNIIELENGQIHRYAGNYSDFLEKKAARQDNENIELDKNKKLLKKELEWVRRMPQARSTKAKSRVDAFYDLKDKVGGRKEQKDLQIDIKGQRLGKKILEAHNIGKKYDEFVAVQGFSYKFKTNERVGILGPNGVGKSTFLKMLTEEIRPDTGKVVVGENTVFGYYSQDGIQLSEDKRVIDVIRDIAEFIPLEKGLKLTAPQVLERFLFDRKQQQVYVSQLSGGERRRLHLLTILMSNPNFLILDEPTNDLDIVTLNVLEEFLMEFPGCILIVSHDRFFMNKLVDHLFIFEGNGLIRDFNGDYNDYREDLLEREREQKRQDRELHLKAKEAQPVVAGTKPGLSTDDKKKLKKLEKEIFGLEERKAEIMALFNDMSGLVPQQIEKLSVELGTINKSLEGKEFEWMELADKG